MRLFALLVTLVFAEQCLAERVINLPETGGRWHLTIITSANNTQRDQELLHLIDSDPAMQSLVQQTIVTKWDDNSPFVQRSDWSTYLGSNRPAILIQADAAHTTDGRGPVVYFASGEHLHTNKNLARSIQRAINAHTEDCPLCPRPTPRPEPSPVVPIQPTVPAVEPVEPERESYIPLWAFIFPLLGAAAGLWKAFREESNGA